MFTVVALVSRTTNDRNRDICKTSFIIRSGRDICNVHWSFTEFKCFNKKAGGCSISCVTDKRHICYMDTYAKCTPFECTSRRCCSRPWRHATAAMSRTRAVTHSCRSTRRVEQGRRTSSKPPPAKTINTAHAYGWIALAGKINAIWEDCVAQSHRFLT